MDMDEHEQRLKHWAYRIPTACRLIGLGRTRLYELIAEGRIKAVSCGRRTLIPAASLQDFLASLPPAAIQRKLEQQPEPARPNGGKRRGSRRLS